MKKKTKKGSNPIAMNRRNLAIGVITVGALGALAFMVLSFSNKGPGTQYGVGADGFQVSEVKGADLGIDKVVSKSDIAAELGNKAKTVSDVEKSGVINLNGNKGQTATYTFTTSNGVKASVYVDVLIYPNQTAYNNDNVFAGTGSAGTVNGKEIRFLPAASLGPDREYALLVSQGVKSYKFAMTQPNQTVEIDEATAHALLKKLIAKASM